MESSGPVPAVGLDGNHPKLRCSKLLMETAISNFSSTSTPPDAIETEPTLANEIGMHRVAFQVDSITTTSHLRLPPGTDVIRFAVSRTLRASTN